MIFFFLIMHGPPTNLLLLTLYLCSRSKEFQTLVFVQKLCLWYCYGSVSLYPLGLQTSKHIENASRGARGGGWKGMDLRWVGPPISWKHERYIPKEKKSGLVTTFFSAHISIGIFHCGHLLQLDVSLVCGGRWANVTQFKYSHLGGYQPRQRMQTKRKKKRDDHAIINSICCFRGRFHWGI